MIARNNGDFDSKMSKESNSAGTMNAIGQVFHKVKADYIKNSTLKTQLVDVFLLWTLATAATQLVYVILVGTFPFNAFLSSFFCHIGLFAFGASLRLSLSSSEFKSITPEKAFGEFAFCALVLFFVVFSFMG